MSENQTTPTGWAGQRWHVSVGNYDIVSTHASLNESLRAFSAEVSKLRACCAVRLECEFSDGRTVLLAVFPGLNPERAMEDEQ